MAHKGTKRQQRFLQQAVNLSMLVIDRERPRLPDELSAEDFDLIWQARRQQDEGFGIEPPVLRKMEERGLMKYL